MEEISLLLKEVRVIVDKPSNPSISVAVGVTVGLLASFVQSLGLTIQRKSHLQNELLPYNLRIKDYKRPLWLTGFIIFICSNILGTIFQIGALPMIVLGPLGAVSLLYNAFFARLILGDQFSIHLILGTILIAGGAVLIGIFGVVPEQTHTLDELIKLYSRPTFIIWISLLSFSLAILVTAAHLTEWRFERKLLSTLPSNIIPSSTTSIENDPNHISLPSTPTKSSSSNLWRKKFNRPRRWSTSISGGRSHSSPILSESQHSNNKILYGSIHDGIEGNGNNSNSSSAMRRNGSVIPIVRIDPFSDNEEPDELEIRNRNGNGNVHHQETSNNKRSNIFINHDELIINESTRLLSPLSSLTGEGIVLEEEAEGKEDQNLEKELERTRLILGIAYGSASGTLSGLCLLFAKTGVELLILTVVGQNQFDRIEAWLIVFVLLVAAVLQLFYLNRALRLVGPTLICPLAFCCYNLSSMISGLIYYNQWKMLSSLQFFLVSLGTGILLTGVWIVSIKSNDNNQLQFELNNNLNNTIKKKEGEEEEEEFNNNNGRNYSSRCTTDNEDEDSYSEDSEGEDLTDWLPRGLTIGIGAASPGFEIRPASMHHSHSHHHQHRRYTSIPQPPLASPLRASSSSTSNLPTHSNTGAGEFPLSSPNLSLNDNLSNSTSTRSEGGESNLFNNNNNELQIQVDENELPNTGGGINNGWNSELIRRRERSRGYSISGALYVGHHGSGNSGNNRRSSSDFMGVTPLVLSSTNNNNSTSGEGGGGSHSIV